MRASQPSTPSPVPDRFRAPRLSDGSPGAEVARSTAAGMETPAAVGVTGEPRGLRLVDAESLDTAFDPGLGWGWTRRPLSRRVLRPAFGVLLVLLGLVLWILPVVPGFVLAVIGAPMVVGIWPRREARLRRWIQGRLARFGWRRPRRRASVAGPAGGPKGGPEPGPERRPGSA